MEKPEIDVSVIVPAYNEISLIANTISEIKSFLSENLPNSEIIIVDDGSTDGTGDTIQNIIKANNSNVKIILVENGANYGKGFSIKNGVFASHGKVIVFIDADLPYDLISLKTIVSKINAGTGIMAGSRSLSDAIIAVDIPLPRKVISKVYQLIVQILFNIGIDDTQCGFKGFSRAAAFKVFSKTQIKGFGFDIEAFVVAKKNGYSTETFPVIFNSYRDDSRIQFFRDTPSMIRDLIRVKLNLMNGKYG